MPKRIEVKLGEKFGKLTIIKEVQKRAGKRYFLCLCDCGNKREERLVALRAGKIKSCGCARNERNRISNLSHGLSGTSLYGSWHGMKQRCLNPNSKNYKYYGGRGITVCQEWIEFETFCQWAISHGYKNGLTIERIDPNGNYEPRNCSWIPKSEQSNNTCRSKRINFQSKTQTLRDWANELNMDYKMLQRRLAHGWSVEKTFTTPLQERYSFKKPKTA